MFRLFTIIYGMAGPALASVAVVLWLTAPAIAASVHILAAAALGGASAVPLAWYVTRRLAAPR